MEASSTARVLVVAHKTAATPALMNAIRERAARGPARFHLLVPNPHHPDLRHPSEVTHPNVTEGEQVLALALPLIEEACGGRPTDGSVSPRHNPMDAIEETLHDGGLRRDHPLHAAPRGVALAAPRPAPPGRPPRPAPDDRDRAGAGEGGRRVALRRSRAAASPGGPRSRPARDRQEGDERQDAAQEDVAGAGRAEAQAAVLVAVLRHLVADRRAQRAGEDVGQPEGQDRVQPEARSARW